MHSSLLHSPAVASLSLSCSLPLPSLCGCVHSIHINHSAIALQPHTTISHNYGTLQCVYVYVYVVVAAFVTPALFPTFTAAIVLASNSANVGPFTHSLTHTFISILHINTRHHSTHIHCCVCELNASLECCSVCGVDTISAFVCCCCGSSLLCLHSLLPFCFSELLLIIIIHHILHSTHIT